MGRMDVGTSVHVLKVLETIQLESAVSPADLVYL